MPTKEGFVIATTFIPKLRRGSMWNDTVIKSNAIETSVSSKVLDKNDKDFFGRLRLFRDQHGLLLLS